ncbi:hypothetical protein Zmor_003264 [Zophobas morio]|uniref:Uncharacterized protein n=1 Tax=Zophobas morio TaxID=2755281 RepID=A0AA38M1S7_9CUCU|nr:hypothetical protein Zmor_003224 [Zophobas morio]KAJ3639937.1 hypothetical protein Zmor_003264 [Zophobas morio]
MLFVVSCGPAHHLTFLFDSRVILHAVRRRVRNVFPRRLASRRSVARVFQPTQPHPIRGLLYESLDLDAPDATSADTEMQAAAVRKLFSRILQPPRHSKQFSTPVERRYWRKQQNTRKFARPPVPQSSTWRPAFHAKATSLNPPTSIEIFLAERRFLDLPSSKILTILFYSR